MRPTWQTCMRAKCLRDKTAEEKAIRSELSQKSQPGDRRPLSPKESGIIFTSSSPVSAPKRTSALSVKFNSTDCQAQTSREKLLCRINITGLKTKGLCLLSYFSVAATSIKQSNKKPTEKNAASPKLSSMIPEVGKV